LTKPIVKYSKENLSKWLLSIAILLSAFAFSGYVNNSVLLSNAKAQTELVCSTKVKVKKSTVFIKKVIHSFDRHTFFNYLSTHFTTLFFSHNRLVKVKLENISKQYKSTKQADKFVQLKNIPANSSKDIFISIG
jgi:hypothetical protein